MDEKIIRHYGTPRRSGRYPWGSGKKYQQSGKSTLGMAEQLKAKGFSEKEIADGLGMSISELRRQKSIEKAEKRAQDAALALRLKDKGMSNVAIGKRMNINESSVRALLDPALKERAEIAKNTAKMLKSTIKNKGTIDIGDGVESGLGITKTKLATAVQILENEGYKVYYVKTKQLGTGKYTYIKVLAKPGEDYSSVYANRANIATITDHSYDGGRTYLGLDPIKSVKSGTVLVRYAEDGGSDKDGVIELRRGIKDLDLGESRYAQVRIGVDDTHFLKGMAMYSEADFPEGVNIIYNTSKKKSSVSSKTDVFKEMTDDPDNPFGTTIKRDGQRGALNIVNEEGDWSTWSRNLSSQVLSKQRPSLAKKQLGLSLDLKQEEFDELITLTNPVVKQKLLQSFADDCDSSAVHLKAAFLPRQSNHIILPITSLKENEVYAPTFNDGEVLALLRHPHGGTFEIPIVKVNNKNPEANSVMKNAKDAIGIHPSVAARLSGADFDGDTVIAVPNSKGYIKASPSLKALKGFEPKDSYAPFDGMKTIDGGTYDAKTNTVNYGGKNPRKATKQLEMGNVSNLITDMTIKGATDSEIARAVKHSMVVIDSEKHHLDYKRSAIENGIAELKKVYQGGERAGASTLISKSSSEKRVSARKDNYKINPKTGEKVYTKTGETYVNKAGKVVKRTTRSTKMAEAKNAFNLSSGTKIESVYAEYANGLKALGNKARLALIKTSNLKYSPTANKTYSKQVESLKAKLQIAKRNKPYERKAQLLADAVYREKLKANPGMDPSTKKKIKGQALVEARHRVGAKKDPVVITDKEWEAIQLGALSHSTVKQILNNTNERQLKQRALPRTAYKMTPVKVRRAQSMQATGYTTAEIAASLGVSTTTVLESLG